MTPLDVPLLAMKAQQKAGFAMILFGLGERDKAKDNPSLAASSKSMPCRERPGVNSWNRPTPNVNPSLTLILLRRVARLGERGVRRLRARHRYALGAAGR